MVVKRQCSFCASEIEPGTGSMFVKKDGTVFHFCSSSCRKQQLHLGRVGHRFKWTRAHALKVAADRTSPAKAPGFRAQKGRASGRATPGKGTAAPPAQSATPAADVLPSPPAPAVEPTPPAEKPPKPRRRTRKKSDTPPPEP
jgi:large subunit ribosomal protein L24e